MPVTIQYQVEYEVCALLFLLVLTFRFFSIRQFPGRTTRLFGAVLVCASADLALDILSSFTIMNVAVLPPWVNYLVNIVFYSLQVVIPVLMMTYVIYTTDRSYRENPKLVLLLLPAAIFSLMLLSNPFTGSVFYVARVDGVAWYYRGPLFSTLYLSTVFYMAASLGLTVLWRAEIDPSVSRTIFLFMCLVAVAVVVQYFFPRLLLTGVAMALAIQMMYFTLQNPEDMLDQISGVFNYNALMRYLASTVSRRETLQLLAVDVGGLRRANDVFGLLVGNEALRQIGLFLSGQDSRAWVFRMQGTRFLLVIPGEGLLFRIMADVAHRFDRDWDASGNRLRLNAALRYYCEPDPFRSPEEVITLVEAAYADLDAVGWSLRQRITRDVVEGTRRRTQVENALRRALETRHGFSLEYQPVYRVADGAYPGAEALLRLRDPQLGRVSPGEFIPVAERSGLILRIDEFVLRTACRFLAVHPELEFLEVNLSSAEFFADPSEKIVTILTETGVQPSRLCLEVTETAAVSYPENLWHCMERLIALGVCFALDDFGTGYANINQVASLPLSVVKLDRALLEGEEKARTLFHSLSQMFHRIGLDVISEGVETREQQEWAAPLVDYIQGFCFARPMAEDALLEFMRARQGEGISAAGR